jgi:hypothetical protein
MAIITKYQNALATTLVLFSFSCASMAQQANNEPGPSLSSVTERELRERIGKLEARLADLEARFAPASPAAQGSTAAQTTIAPATASSTALRSDPNPDAKEQLSPTGDSLSLPGFASGTTLNFLLDGYYEYNFNKPVGRVNLLRPYDPTSNNFTVNQAVISVERQPQVDKGRRFGMRLDFMFGQATESLAGTPANEPRTPPYRNIYQAYGTYVLPLGTGLNVDFGRFTGSLGYEGTFTKDQMNYSRAFWFAALPFYHSGFRTLYKFNDKISATWLLVNGANQSEDFNGFKSNQLTLNTALAKNLSWTASYYIGQEGRDVVPPAPTNFPPPIATQPGLSIDKIVPTPNGRMHFLDSHLTWSATPKLTLVGEGDYVVSRSFQNSAPVGLSGFAAYSKYQFTPAFSLAGRFEYMNDHGGFFSGTTQALKEGTLTATLQPLDGFQVRWEFRHDYSNQPYFLTRHPGALKKEQSTALLGLIWWFGGRPGAW